MTLVLVVDDVPALAQQYAYDLKRVGGYEVLTAAKGSEALDLVTRSGVDCMILDLEMPGMDGFEVLRALNQQGSEVPVIVYTGTGDYDRCIQAVQPRRLRLHRQGRADGAGGPGGRDRAGAKAAPVRGRLAAAPAGRDLADRG